MALTIKIPSNSFMLFIVCLHAHEDFLLVACSCFPAARSHYWGASMCQWWGDKVSKTWKGPCCHGACGLTWKRSRIKSETECVCGGVGSTRHELKHKHRGVWCVWGEGWWRDAVGDEVEGMEQGWMLKGPEWLVKEFILQVEGISEESGKQSHPTWPLFQKDHLTNWQREARGQVRTHPFTQRLIVVHFLCLCLCLSRCPYPAFFARFLSASATLSSHWPSSAVLWFPSLCVFNFLFFKKIN